MKNDVALSVVIADFGAMLLGLTKLLCMFLCWPSYLLQWRRALVEQLSFPSATHAAGRRTLRRRAKYIFLSR